MAVKDNFVMSDESAKALGKGLQVAGVGGRIGIYLVMYVPLVIIIIIMSISMGSHDFSKAIGISPEYMHELYKTKSILRPIIGVFIHFFIPALPFVLIDWMIRVGRRKQGLSVWGNISEELAQREVDIRVAREQKAYVKLNDEKKDIRYYHDLLKDGVISEKEFEVKKKELL